MILIGLTVITGMVDALSILALGRVFVANMTGNVVFIAFAAGGAPGFSLVGSAVALLGFLAGATVGGFLIGRTLARRRALLQRTVLAQTTLMVAALAVAVARPVDMSATTANLVVVLAALGLGLQNATVRHLAVPDITTTVLTMAITGIGSDLRVRDGAAVGRRLLSVTAMFLGALAGTILFLQWGAVPTLAVIAGCYLALALALAVDGRGHPAWETGRS